MRAKITKIGEQQDSKHGGKYMPVYFKSLDDGKSYRTCIYLVCRNWHEWAFILQPGYNLNTILDGLTVSQKDEHLFDADFAPRITRPAIPEQELFPGNPVAKQPDLFSNYDEGKKRLAEARLAMAGVR